MNAMEQVHTPHRTLLAKSFQFGPEIVAAASIILRGLDAWVPVEGVPTLLSHVCPDSAPSHPFAPEQALSAMCLPHSQRSAMFVVGGTSELERLLDIVKI